MQVFEPEANLPGAEVIGTYAEMAGDDWHNLRKTGVGGSEAGVILGMSRYSSPLALWAEKTGRMPREEIDSEFAEMGTLLEPFIRRELVGPYLSERIGIGVDIVEPTAMYQSKEWPWMLANVDGFVLYDGRTKGLEIKTGTSYQVKDWGGVDGDELPDRYYAQVQHYMAVLGLDLFFVFGVIGNQRLLRSVPRNDRFIADLVERERAFWEAVESNDPLQAPAPMGLDSDMDAIWALGDPRQDEMADLSPVDHKMKEQIKEMEKVSKAYLQEIALALGNAKKGESDTAKVSMVEFERAMFDSKRFEQENPELAEEYKRTVEVRYPRISGKGPHVE